MHAPDSDTQARLLGCRLPHRLLEIRFFCAFDAIGELNSESVIGTPGHAALAGATVTLSESQHELIRDTFRSHASNFCATVRKVAHNAWTGQFAIIDRRGRVPLNPDALAPLMGERNRRCRGRREQQPLARRAARVRSLR